LDGVAVAAVPGASVLLIMPNGRRGPRLVALSGHDSTPWTFSAFADRFGDRCRTLRAGEEITISAAAAR
jgi:hypothetical protein